MGNFAFEVKNTTDIHEELTVLEVQQLTRPRFEDMIEVIRQGELAFENGEKRPLVVLLDLTLSKDALGITDIFSINKHLNQFSNETSAWFLAFGATRVQIFAINAASQYLPYRFKLFGTRDEALEFITDEISGLFNEL